MEDLNQSLEASILSKDTQELVVDYSELALDKILDSEILSEVPIIKSIIGIYKIGVGIKERATIKKITKFLFQLQSVPIEEKDTFFNMLSGDEGYKNYITEKLLILLDRLDDLEKAEIIGNLFKATIQGKVNIDTFLKLSSIVDRIYIMDIKAFCFSEDYSSQNEKMRRKWFEKYTTDVKKNLSSNGLLTEEIEANKSSLATYTGTDELEYSFKFKITNLGNGLVSYAKPRDN